MSTEEQLQQRNKELEALVESLKTGIQLLETGKYGRNELHFGNLSLREEIEALKREVKQWQEKSVESYDIKDRINKAEIKLEQLGLRHCDIAACNCNGYHRWEPDKASNERDQLRAELENWKQAYSKRVKEINELLLKADTATSLLRRAHPNVHTTETGQWFNDVNEFLKGETKEQ